MGSTYLIKSLFSGLFFFSITFTGLVYFANSKLLKNVEKLNELNDRINELDSGSSSNLAPTLTIDDYINSLKRKNWIVEKDKDSVWVTLTQDILFRIGDVKITKGGIDKLSNLCLMINKFESNLDELIIEGHTDQTPIKTPIHSKHGIIEDNRTLSFYRGVEVASFFTSYCGIKSNKITIIPRGSTRPIFPKGSPLDAKNRRIEISFKFKNF